MEQLVFLAPFIPFFAMIPPSLAAVWIASRWLKTRGTTEELRNELAALREELAALRQSQGDSQERLDFAERLIAQLRERRPEISRGET